MWNIKDKPIFMVVAAVAVSLIIAILWFYRRIPGKTYGESQQYAPNVVLSAAHGKIAAVEEKTIDGKTYWLIATTLTLGDIHRQYYPMSGIVSNVEYDNTGRFHLATDLDKSQFNEKAIHTLTTTFGDLKIYQIAGKNVRRIDYWHASHGGAVRAQEFGIIHFGSRVDLLIPAIHATDDKVWNFVPDVQVGQKISGRQPVGLYKVAADGESYDPFAISA